jgi:hypothetical protein
MAKQQQIKNKTEYYVTVITAPSSHKLQVVQLDIKINHRLSGKLSFIVLFQEVRQSNVLSHTN